MSFDYVYGGAVAFDGDATIGREVADVGWLAPHPNQVRLQGDNLVARAGPQLLAHPDERAKWDPRAVALIPLAAPTSGGASANRQPGLPNTCRWVQLRARLLDDFKDLASTTEVLTFAQHWGPLRELRWDGSAEIEHREAVDFWLATAAAAQAILKFIALLHQPGEVVEHHVLSTCTDALRRWVDMVDTDAKLGSPKKSDATVVLNGSLALWSRAFGAPKLGVFIEAQQGQPRFGWEVDSLGGALGLQLTFATTGAPHRVAVCRECFSIFSPTRKPAAGRDSYCPAHKSAAQRNGQQRSRARRRAVG